ncbi:hypothetical protein AGMMS50256_32170 [Betaproteobacteria bacterium]|nr:hypothetical protein AGMMS50256_32140 [Betaproteobacteria bacterium]GHU36072.1 hypothetical protein AGMMS50256_32170 [Betaproteobacteria bacterium]
MSTTALGDIDFELEEVARAVGLLCAYQFRLNDIDISLFRIGTEQDENLPNNSFRSRSSLRDS